MTFGYSSYPSILWAGIAIVLLVLIGGAIAMIHRKLKKIILSKYLEKKLIENVSKINGIAGLPSYSSWSLFLL
ncbi:hypothetical protein NSS71_20825 [Niallia sp. FSL W8-0951]|jgi:high-affinity Fe2+/Pb2+ permease|uniref:hypothetical protein n=1 Tax=Niallia TaxID=2837506 RepID=UPI001F3221AD|nr:hypothetical protein [Niallia circulans]MCM2981715.1 hypothetical protein [Niallia circulans]